MIEIVTGFAALVVVLKTIDVCAHIDIHNFDGHPLVFAGMALYWALFGAGSVAVAAGVPVGGLMLLGGLAVFCLVNRRRHP